MQVWKGHVGIAHTRWATHGSPNAINSHPQVSDARKEFVVVHNGIITNHKALREFLVTIYLAFLKLQFDAFMPASRRTHACCDKYCPFLSLIHSNRPNI